jgi:hypothetical protein
VAAINILPDTENMPNNEPRGIKKLAIFKGNVLIPLKSRTIEGGC